MNRPMSRTPSDSGYEHRENDEQVLCDMVCHDTMFKSHVRVEDVVRGSFGFRFFTRGDADAPCEHDIGATNETETKPHRTPDHNPQEHFSKLSTECQHETKAVVQTKPRLPAQIAS